MAQEIEKKFLLSEDEQDYSTPQLMTIYPSLENLELDVLCNGNKISQGYLPLDSGIGLAKVLKMNFDFKPKEARLRYKAGKFYFTLKGDGSLFRGEAEKEVDKTFFDTWWSFTQGRRIEKVRLERPYQSHILELDVYTDRDLIIAEIEVPSIEIANFLIPLGKDVTEDSKYKNRNLAK